MKLIFEIRIRLLAIKYFIQQNFTDWEYALWYARWIKGNGWQKK